MEKSRNYSYTISFPGTSYLLPESCCLTQKDGARRPEYLCPEQKMEPSLYASCPLPDSEDSVPHLTVKNIYGASTTVYSQSKRMGEETYFGNLTVLHPNRARSQNNTILLLHNYYYSTTTALC